MICMMDLEIGGDYDYRPTVDKCPHYQKKRQKHLTKKQLKVIRRCKNESQVCNWDYLDPNGEFSEITNSKNKFVGHTPQDAYEYCVLIESREIEESYYNAERVGYPFSKIEANERLRELCKHYKRVFKVEKAEILNDEQVCFL